MFFWNSFAFSMIQWMLAIWSLVPLPFLKLVITWSLSSQSVTFFLAKVSALFCEEITNSETNELSHSGPTVYRERIKGPGEGRGRTLSDYVQRMGIRWFWFQRRSRPGSWGAMEQILKLESWLVKYDLMVTFNCLLFFFFGRCVIFFFFFFWGNCLLLI